MEEAYKIIAEIIKGNETFLVASHAHPDGDGIGSTLAMGLAIKSFGKKVVMYNRDRVPKILDFLAGADQLVNKISANDKFDVSIMVDCAQPERVGDDFPPPERRGKLVCIDHHFTDPDPSAIACQDEKASSTGEVVYNILDRLGIEIDPDIATMILTTIIVDTGFFRYSNTTSHALNMAAELVSIGADTWTISKNMEERTPPEQLKLLASVIDTIEYLLEGRLALMILTKQMFTYAKADIEMAEEFINYARSVKDIEVAALIREKTKNEYKISLRSKNSINVAKLASKFDGGGHEHAAGCTIEGSLGIVKQKVIKAVEEALDRT